MKKNKLNCWEAKKCGREKGGAKTNEFGICPVSEEKNADGFHGGKNGGRCCWTIAGTFCKNTVQGSFAQKYDDCQKCDFYQDVIKEESKSGTLTLTSEIIKKLKSNNKSELIK